MTSMKQLLLLVLVLNSSVAIMMASDHDLTSGPDAVAGVKTTIQKAQESLRITHERLKIINQDLAFLRTDIETQRGFIMKLSSMSEDASKAVSHYEKLIEESKTLLIVYEATLKESVSLKKGVYKLWHDMTPEQRIALEPRAEESIKRGAKMVNEQKALLHKLENQIARAQGFALGTKTKLDTARSREEELLNKTASLEALVRQLETQKALETIPLEKEILKLDAEKAMMLYRKHTMRYDWPRTNSEPTS